MIFVDTSAWYAHADRADSNRDHAEEIFSRLCVNGDELITHNYIVVESVALMQYRLGSGVAKQFLADRAPIVDWKKQATLIGLNRLSR